MRRTWPLDTLWICAASALLLLPLDQPALASELGRLALDDASALGTTISTDSSVKQEGEGSVRISTAWPTTISLGEVSDLDVDNARLVYQAKVRSEGLEGTAFLEMWCHVGGGQYFSRGMNSVVTDTMEWKTLQTPFMLQPGQRATKASLNLVINGRGTVWVDDVRLLQEALE